MKSFEYCRLANYFYIQNFVIYFSKRQANEQLPKSVYQLTTKHYLPLHLLNIRFYG